MIKNFSLTNVRCFKGVNEFNIRPITFLVGENSTGKTTMLGCLQAFGDSLGEASFSDLKFDFNKPPYLMGSFQDIVRKSRPLIEKFTLSLTIIGTKNNDTTVSVIFDENKDGSEAEILSVTWSTGGISVTKLKNIEDLPAISGKMKKYTTLLRIVGVIFDSRPDHLYLVPRENSDRDSNLNTEMMVSFNNLSHIIQFLSTEAEDNSENLSLLSKFHASFVLEEGRRYRPQLKFESIAPIRSQPQRTYDPVREEITSEGTEMPYLLSNLKRTRHQHWEKLRAVLLTFGRDSGLFKDITVRLLGKSSGNPFQLQFTVRGPKSNIMDVGYGISQIMPILTKILGYGSMGALRNWQTYLLLLQHPEIHLHPRGQAAFLSLLVKIIKGTREKEKTPQFIVETHSDYMIDRARIEIMKGNLNHKDVSLIYLEPNGNFVDVHNIEFDQQGAMTNVPPGYRDFFLKETADLFGFNNSE